MVSEVMMSLLPFSFFLLQKAKCYTLDFTYWTMKENKMRDTTQCEGEGREVQASGLSVFSSPLPGLSSFVSYFWKT